MMPMFTTERNDTVALTTIGVDSPIRGLADELRRQLDTKRDLMADTRRVSMTPRLGVDGDRTGYVGVELGVDAPDGAEFFPVTRHAHGQIAEHLGLPWKLYEKLDTKHPDLLAGLANGLLSREPSKQMLRILDGKVRAFLSDRYRPRDNWDLVENALLPELSAFHGAATFKRCDLTETRMYVKIVFPDIEAPITPAVGDVVRAGLIVQNSEVGNGALGIFPYTDRLACTNGMVHTEFGQRARHVGGRITGGDAEVWDLYSDETLALDDAAFFSKCRDTIRAVLNESVFDRIVAQMRDLADIEIPGAVAAVEILADRHKLTDTESASMLDTLVRGGDLSAWGYVNAITTTARDTSDADRQTELETLAGNLTSDPSWARKMAVA
jgi:hypothetical protein